MDTRYIPLRNDVPRLSRLLTDPTVVDVAFGGTALAAGIAAWLLAGPGAALAVTFVGGLLWLARPDRMSDLSRPEDVIKEQVSADTPRPQGRRLSNRERLLETVASSSPVGMFTLHGKTWTFANPRLSEISGLSAADLLEGRLWDAIRPEGRPGREGAIGTLSRGPAHGESAPPDQAPAAATTAFAGGYYRLVHPEVGERSIRLTMARVRGSGGRGWVGTVEDTTEELAVREHAALLATVASGTTDLVVISGADGKLLFLNEGGLAMMGMPRGEDVTGMHISQVFGEAGWRRLEVVALPTATTQGTWSGDAEIVGHAVDPRPVSVVIVCHRDALGRVDQLSIQARDTSSQKAVERQLVLAATHDQLTGLPNRARFNDVLANALATASRGGGTVAVLFCDLDRFKSVNDMFGHAAGDLLLREVARRLGAVMRDADVAARVGGDEFLILATDMEGPQAALQMGERVRQVLDSPIVIDEHTAQLSFSVGVVLNEPADSPKTIIARADQAMYRAKSRGKNRVQMYRDGDWHRGPASPIAQRALREAIHDGALSLHYQPIIDLPSGRITGGEAMVRWQHGELGLLRPRDFMDLAEETGLVLPLGNWVLGEAIRQAGAWSSDDELTSELRISVNVSSLQLLDGDLAARTEAMMAAMSVAPSSLCVEVTERSLSDDDDKVRSQLHAFREMGVRVAVDEFGTGFSSLAHLRRLPIDALKLDAAFVAGLGRSPADEAIVATIKGLADALGLITVAEGVQTPAQLRKLIEIGCEAAQGPLLSDAVDGQTFRNRVANEGAIHPSATPGSPDCNGHGSGDITEKAVASSDHSINK